MLNVSKKLIFANEITTDPKYHEIFKKLETKFRANGLYLSSRFDKRVFFLIDDKDYINSFTQNTFTPKNILYEILLELNESEDPRNFQNLKVSVENFIYKVAETLLLANSAKNRSHELIKQYNAQQRKNEVEEKLKILKEKSEYRRNYIPTTSQLTFTLVKLDGFPTGDFSFDLKVMELLPDEKIKSNTIISNKILSLKDNINVVNDNETINLHKNVKDINNYAFETFEFRTFDSKFNELFDKDSYSGTTFSAFSLSCERKNRGIKYESKLEYFLRILLIYVDDLIDISKEIITKNIQLKLKSDNSSASDVNAIVEMKMNVDIITRATMLRRVNDILCELIETYNSNDTIINEILDNYFRESSESIKHILEKPKDESRDACCASCLII
jgi:hypothetical protein